MASSAAVGSIPLADCTDSAPGASAVESAGMTRDGGPHGSTPHIPRASLGRSDLQSIVVWTPQAEISTRIPIGPVTTDRSATSGQHLRGSGRAAQPAVASTPAGWAGGCSDDGSGTIDSRLVEAGAALVDQTHDEFGGGAAASGRRQLGRRRRQIRTRFRPASRTIRGFGQHRQVGAPPSNGSHGMSRRRRGEHFCQDRAIRCLNDPGCHSILYYRPLIGNRLQRCSVLGWPPHAPGPCRAETIIGPRPDR